VKTCSQWRKESEENCGCGVCCTSSSLQVAVDVPPTGIEVLAVKVYGCFHYMNRVLQFQNQFVLSVSSTGSFSNVEILDFFLLFLPQNGLQDVSKTEVLFLLT
jgi:hypothetical protein